MKTLALPIIIQDLIVTADKQLAFIENVYYLYLLQN